MVMFPRPWPFTLAWIGGELLIFEAGARAQNVLAMFIGLIAWGLICQIAANARRSWRTEGPT